MERRFTTTHIQSRTDNPETADIPKIEGHAVVFDATADLGAFTETIDRKAFEGRPGVTLRDDLGRECVRVFGPPVDHAKRGAVFFARGHTGDEKFSLQLHNQITLPRRMSQGATQQSDIDDLV